MKRACKDPGTSSPYGEEDDCNKQMSWSEEAGQQEPLQTQKAFFTCGHCGKVFECEGDLISHVVCKHTHPTCSYCYRSFKNISSLNKHIRTHTGETPFSCEYCDKKFTQSGHLRSHLRTHLQPMNFRCEVCDRCFNYKVSLTRHMWTHDKSRGTPYVCDVCGKNFRQKSHLDEHYRRHTGEKPYQCDVCGKCFTNQGSVVTHKVKLHSGTYDTTISSQNFAHQSTQPSNTSSRNIDGEQEFRGESGMSYYGSSNGDCTQIKQNEMERENLPNERQLPIHKQPQQSQNFAHQSTQPSKTSSRNIDGEQEYTGKSGMPYSGRSKGDYTQIKQNEMERETLPNERQLPIHKQQSQTFAHQSTEPSKTSCRNIEVEQEYTGKSGMPYYGSSNGDYTQIKHTEMERETLPNERQLPRQKQPQQSKTFVHQSTQPSKTSSRNIEVEQEFRQESGMSYSGTCSSNSDFTQILVKHNEKERENPPNEGKSPRHKQPLVSTLIPGLPATKESSEMNEEEGLARPVTEIPVQHFPKPEGAGKILEGEATHDHRARPSGWEAISEGSATFENCSNCDTCKKAINLLSPFLMKLKFYGQPLSMYLQKQ